MHVHTFFQRLSDINHVERQRLLMKELLGHNASSTIYGSTPGLITGGLPKFCGDYTVASSQDLTTV